MIGSAWNRFWFAEVPLTRVAAFRMLMLALAILALVAYSVPVFADARALTNGQPTRLWNPIYLFEILQLEPIELATAQWIFWIGIVSAGLGIVGLFTRTACLVAAVVCIYWTGLVYSYGKAHHDRVAFAFALMVLPLAPVGARLSLDSLIARYRRARRGLDPAHVPQTSEFAGVPLRLTQLTVTFGYFFAGATKLVISGPGWANGYTLMAIMMEHNSEWSLFFSQNLFVCQVVSALSLTLQTTFPIILVFPTLRWIYLPGLVAFHVGTWQTMDTGPYMTLWFALICFLPLERIPAWVTRRPWLHVLIAAIPTALVLYVFSLYFPWWSTVFLVPFAAALVVLFWPKTEVAVVYDGACGMCRRALAVLKALDWKNAIEPVDLRNWSEVSARFPQLDEQACIRDMHAIAHSGHTGAGFAAYQVIAWRLPLVTPLAWLMYLPGITHLGRRVYRHVADNRVRQGCGDDSCPIHPG